MKPLRTRHVFSLAFFSLAFLFLPVQLFCAAFCNEDGVEMKRDHAIYQCRHFAALRESSPTVAPVGVTIQQQAEMIFQCSPESKCLDFSRKNKRLSRTVADQHIELLVNDMENDAYSALACRLSSRARARGLHLTQVAVLTQTQIVLSEALSDEYGDEVLENDPW
jgi:hypothetical protein